MCVCVCVCELGGGGGLTPGCVYPGWREGERAHGVYACVGERKGLTVCMRVLGRGKGSRRVRVYPGRRAHRSRPLECVEKAHSASLIWVVGMGVLGRPGVCVRRPRAARGVCAPSSGGPGCVCAVLGRPGVCVRRPCVAGGVCAPSSGGPGCVCAVLGQPGVCVRRPRVARGVCAPSSGSPGCVCAVLGWPRVCVCAVLARPGVCVRRPRAARGVCAPSSPRREDGSGGHKEHQYGIQPCVMPKRETHPTQSRVQRAPLCYFQCALYPSEYGRNEQPPVDLQRTKVE